MGEVELLLAAVGVDNPTREEAVVAYVEDRAHLWDQVRTAKELLQGRPACGVERRKIFHQPDRVAPKSAQR